MAKPGKSSGIGGVKPRSFLLTALVLVIVASLFFIPELVDFQKTVTGGHETTALKDPVAAPGSAAEHELHKEASGGTPLDRISSLIETGYIESLKARKVLSTAQQAPPPEDEPAPGTPPKFSWEGIRSKGSVDALRAAEREALTLARNLPNQKVASRYALYNFVSGVRLIIDGPDKSMTADEAVRYLEFLHMAVSRTLAREKVDRADYNRWAAIALGPVMEQSRAFRLAQQRAPFNPQLTLTRVTVRKAGDDYGRYRPRAPVYVQFVGYVVGKDVKKIELYRNSDILVRRLPLQAPGGPGGRRVFNPRQFAASGYYTFRVHDETGQIYQKTYTFFPRAGRFPWRRGVFELPFRSEGDPRVDRFFTYRSGRVVNRLIPEVESGVNQMVRF